MPVEQQRLRQQRRCRAPRANSCSERSCSIFYQDPSEMQLVTTLANIDATVVVDGAAVQFNICIPLRWKSRTRVDDAISA